MPAPAQRPSSLDGGLRRRAPSGLRARLILAIGAVVIITVAVAFAAVYRETGIQLRSQLDSSIRQSASAMAQALREDPNPSPTEVLSAARRYVASQPYSNAAVLLFVLVPGYGTATNHPELFGGRAGDDREDAPEQALENSQGRRLSMPRPGYGTELGPDVGTLRIYQDQVRIHAGLSFYAGAAQPLSRVEEAQHGVLRSFALAGTLALALAVAFAYLLGTKMSSPLRRVSQVAARIDGGDLSPRMGLPPRANRELQVLVQAFNHMLDRLSSAFDVQRQFVADASHELRTPLTVIRGQLDLLAGSEDVSREELLRVERLVQAEISRLTRLTDDLLLLARSDRDDFLRRQSFELAPFISELWDGLSLTAERRFEVGPLAPVTIEADPDRLAQALRNLGSNAVAHTSAPDGLVRIQAESSPRNPRRVLIAVTDDGPGIPAHQRERVFERFYRTDPGRARVQGGAGLGLAIVAAIVEAHGGSVRVGESDAGGARFEIELPL